MVRKTKTFVFDLDGTVLTPKNEFPLETKELIMNILKKGDNVVFATGRMHISAKKLLDRVFGEDVFPIISYNGAVVYVPDKGFIFEKTLELSTAHKVIDFFRRNNIHVQTYVEDILYTEKDNEEIKLYSKHAEVPYTVVDDLKAIHQPPIKILGIGDQELLDRLIPDLKNVVGNSATVFKSFSIFLDVVPADANKGIALRFLADYLKFDLSETIVFGDNENDIFMFEVAGRKIAVSNAVEKLKEVADFVSKSNEENGVYFAFTQLFPEYIV
ncbi:MULTISPECIES: Cof-type HAD-IIB family hydrolase [Fervidobacterium]|uniref:Cof-like hydrolase n=1 Tax=Fervidobacterium nodosum (strain ATCC 35602 / DSM 5306 / Rt17-B1) TaxID=381764 RepID=A7HK89_FERNB|nr:MULTISPECIES: Cof-type HAD-IIB family hydrolase [Fervidobacterium]ABS60322.1 Cof-like hydrolase [Fervidobacterium nodosum Rt17-B1]KAF2961406.1 hydrolase Cof [Fervidobacterium sp. 2310opik-2]PHJ13729.1 hydrolase Cof [Fervidobacterium sp. SC_NGM5_G05]